MNTKKIIAELRRSACEDAQPFFGVSYSAYLAAVNYSLDANNTYRSFAFKKPEVISTFYLLVAEAMEST
jgi:hypothetical protein